MFPVTILSKRGSASLILIMPQKEIKKSTLLDRKRVEYARQKDLQSSTPSYRSWVKRLYKTGSSPDSASSLLQPSRSPQISDFVGFTLHYSGGTVPVFHRSSLLSPTGHLFSYEVIQVPKSPLKNLFARTQRDIYKDIPFPSLVGHNGDPR